MKRKERREKLREASANRKKYEAENARLEEKLKQMGDNECPNDNLQPGTWEQAPRSTQDKIRYSALLDTGLCELCEHIWSVTFTFADISYSLAAVEEQVRIFTKWCEMLNYYTPNMCVQITVRNRVRELEQFKDEITSDVALPEHKDYNDEYNNMIVDTAMKSDSSISKERFLTVTYAAESSKEAEMTAQRIKTDLAKLFKRLHSTFEQLSGTERVQLLRSYTSDTIFDWSFNSLLASGQSTKDYVAPDYMDFSANEKFEMRSAGKTKYGQVLYTKQLPSEMNDMLVKNLCEIECDLTISIFARPVAQDAALDLVKSQLAKMHMQVSSLEQKAAQNNMHAAIPFELSHTIEEANKLLKDLQERNQRLFRVTLLVYTCADDEAQLMNNVYKIRSAAKRCSVELANLEEQQEAGFNSILPLGACHVDIERNLTTAQTSIFIPFAAPELFNPRGLYYGANALSHNLIMVDRKQLLNGQCVIVGVSGAGKSMMGKSEMLGVLFRYPLDVVLTLDPENEYGIIAKSTGGEVIEISTSSDTHLNPFDMEDGYASDGNPIFEKCEYIMTLIETFIGTLDAATVSIIDRAVRAVYVPYFEHKQDKAYTPTFVDFDKVLEKMVEPEAKQLRIELEAFIYGSLSAFAHQTNVDIDNRFVVFNTLKLGNGPMRTIGMLVVADQIWNRVLRNHKAGIDTWVYLDEMQEYFSSKRSSEFFSKLYARIRKRGGYATALTQNVERILANEYARFVVSNSEMVIMLNQASTDRAELASLLDLSPEQEEHITNVDPGQGLIRVSRAVIPFENVIPKGTELYKIMTTKPNESQIAQ